MELPYSLDVYFALMGDYNARWLPVVLSAWVLAALIAALTLRLQRRAAKWISRCLAGYLAASCLWVGVAHQLDMMAELNFMAPYYAAAWIGQGVMLTWFSLSPTGINLGFRSSLARTLSTALILFALVIHPLILLIQGYDWTSLPLAGTAPNPTAILMVGLLLALRTPPRLLFALPLAWAAVAGASAYMLDHAVDYIVVISIVSAVLLALFERHGPARSW